MSSFPRTEVAGVSLPRMLMGTNWLLGWSHTSASADAGIREKYSSYEKFFPVFEAYLEYGVDALMGVVGKMPILQDAVKYAEDRLGKKITLIDTPGIDVSDTKEGRAAARETIQKSADAGSKFCLIHHSSAEQLVNKHKRELTRLPDYLSMIRDAGMIPGLSAHMPELIVYSDANEYDVETYIQIYNCMGFLMQVEVEGVASIIHSAKKPVMTIKSMAAGRVSPYIGLTFSYSTLRPCDMVTVGAFSADEVHEDVEIAMAAIERRFPNLERRASPNPNQAAFGK